MRSPQKSPPAPLYKGGSVRQPTGYELVKQTSRQAQPHAHCALTSLTPYGFRGALSNRRIGGLKDRTITFPYRTVGSARPRTPHLDAIEFMRGFLQHGLPDGFMTVRPFAFSMPAVPSRSSPST
jgi:hypothetical protein